MVLSDHGKCLYSWIPQQLGSRTSEAGLWSGAGLTRNWAISQNTPKSTRSCTLGQSVHYWTLFRCPSRLLGRRTAGVGIGVNTHHRALISDRMAGWPPHRVSEYQIGPRKSYISRNILNLSHGIPFTDRSLSLRILINPHT